MTENTRGMKEMRAYNRLLVAILEHKPEKIIELLAFEYCEPGDRVVGFDEKLKETINKAIRDSINYTIHYQHGCGIAILKESLIAKKLMKESLIPKKKTED